MGQPRANAMPVAANRGKPVLHIVDADASVRDGLVRLAMATGFEAHAYASAEELLAVPMVRAHACVLVDSSLLACDARVRSAMQRRAAAWPMIVLGTGDGPVGTQRARGVGARFLLNKPVDAQALFDAIEWVT